MKAILTIEMDNAAFEPSNGQELGRILEDLARRVGYSALLPTDSYRAVDANGNTVGRLEITD